MGTPWNCTACKQSTRHPRRRPSVPRSFFIQDWSPLGHLQSNLTGKRPRINLCVTEERRTPEGILDALASNKTILNLVKGGLVILRSEGTSVWGDWTRNGCYSSSYPMQTFVVQILVGFYVLATFVVGSVNGTCPIAKNLNPVVWRLADDGNQLAPSFHKPLRNSSIYVEKFFWSNDNEWCPRAVQRLLWIPFLPIVWAWPARAHLDLLRFWLSVGWWF